MSSIIASLHEFVLRFYLFCHHPSVLRHLPNVRHPNDRHLLPNVHHLHPTLQKSSPSPRLRKANVPVRPSIVPAGKVAMRLPFCTASLDGPTQSLTTPGGGCSLTKGRYPVSSVLPWPNPWPIIHIFGFRLGSEASSFGPKTRSRSFWPGNRKVATE